jgi:hypothetical protein
MVPPVVRALLEYESLRVGDLIREKILSAKYKSMAWTTHIDGRRWLRSRPRSQVDSHDEEDRHHPLQQLLIGKFNFVSGFHTICHRYPPRLHQQGGVRYAEAYGRERERDIKLS